MMHQPYCISGYLWRRPQTSRRLLFRIPARDTQRANRLNSCMCWLSRVHMQTLRSKFAANHLSGCVYSKMRSLTESETEWLSQSWSPLEVQYWQARQCFPRSAPRNPPLNCVILYYFTIFISTQFFPNKVGECGAYQHGNVCHSQMITDALTQYRFPI